MNDDFNSDIITVSFTREELSALSGLLIVAMQTFRDKAKQSAREENATNLAIYTAREKLSAIYANKLSDAAAIGEPESKDLH